jgi:RNA polymerase sigma-70 factor (ECF subfamily)
VTKLSAPATRVLGLSGQRAAKGPLPSDPEIVAGLTRGEAWAAQALYDRVQPYVERALRRVLRYGNADYEDLMQASFERIIRVLSERSLGGACDLPSWSSAVAAHVALDALRRRVRERKLFRDEPVVEGVRAVDNNPESAVASGQDIERVQGVLARMKPKHAEAVLLHDVLGHDLSEIATITGASVAAAQSRLVRGRKELLRRARTERRES